MFRYRIGKGVIEVDTLAELDQIVARYSGETGSSPSSTPGGRQGAGDAQSGGDNDMRLLRAFVTAGDRGVPAGTVASLLGGARGRAVPPAVREWGVRVGLDANAAVPTERVNGKRSWKLTGGAQGAAQLILGGGSSS